MSVQPKYTRAMLGYALWVEIEEGLRNWLTRKLSDLFGDKWSEQFPAGLWNKLQTRYNQRINERDFSEIRNLLEHADFPDIFDIIKYRKKVNEFIPQKLSSDLDYYVEKLYILRNQIAHKPLSFNMTNFADLEDCANWIEQIIGNYAKNLLDVKKGIQIDPNQYFIEIPYEFIQSIRTINNKRIPNNLPPMDYESDGGFIGRKDDKRELKNKLLDRRRHRIVTIAGSGGVGKTAIAHNLCEEIIKDHDDVFEAVIWVSAKKDKLTLTGIEEIEDRATSLSDILDAIISTFGFDDYIDKSEEEKLSFVNNYIIEVSELGILLVIDNLETILNDNNLLEFLKEMPSPHKILITSRLGLGEIERRIQILQMNKKDAIQP